MKIMPSKDEIMKIISYDQFTGEFTRLASSHRADTAMKTGYRRIRMTISGVKYEFLAHRLAWLMYHGSWPDKEIDHIDGNRSNNSISNLRHVTRSQNAKNIRLRSDNLSGAFGVSRHQSGWKVRIGSEYVGYFGCFSQAIAARKVAEARNGYHTNHGRTA